VVGCTIGSREVPGERKPVIADDDDDDDDNDDDDGGGGGGGGGNNNNNNNNRLSGIKPLGLLRFRIYFLKLINLFGQLAGVLGRGIGPT
jgi:hypothetical protein